MAEDFNKLRMLAQRVAKTQFQESAMFRLEIEGEPEDFDVYVKDISYSPVELTNEPIKLGGKTINYPTGLEPVTLSLTVRENPERDISVFFNQLANSVINANGTFNLPYGEDGYVKQYRLYTVWENGDEELTHTWDMYPMQCGEVTESRDEPGVLEFPLTFIQFRS
jgi:hypothetical protein